MKTKLALLLQFKNDLALGSCMGTLSARFVTIEDGKIRNGIDQPNEDVYLVSYIYKDQSAAYTPEFSVRMDAHLTSIPQMENRVRFAKKVRKIAASVTGGCTYQMAALVKVLKLTLLIPAGLQCATSYDDYVGEKIEDPTIAAIRTAEIVTKLWKGG